MKPRSFETQLLHAPYEKPDAYGALSLPVYHSVACEFPTAEAMEDAFCARTNDHYYARISNPTVQYYEERIRRTTGATTVTAFNSGMAAIANALMTLAYSGANIVSSLHLFGNTYSLLRNTLAPFGVEARFCDLTNIDAVRDCIDDHTCGVFLEVITNPQLEVADLQALADLAHTAGVPLIADTTIVPFCSFHANRFGVDIEVVSSTKYISGGATSLGGLILDYGSFDWSRNGALHGWMDAAGAKTAFSTRLRKEIHRNIGAYLSPHAAYMQTLGLETLQLRYERQATSCATLARQLQQLKGIVSVNYTGLTNNPYFALSQTQFGDHPGAMLTFDLLSRVHCFAFLNRLQLIRRATNLFDNKSLAIHPASTIYGTLSEAIRQEMDVRQETIRLSVGLEHTDDLLHDIVEALRQ